MCTFALAESRREKKVEVQSTVLIADRHAAARLKKEAEHTGDRRLLCHLREVIQGVICPKASN